MTSYLALLNSVIYRCEKTDEVQIFLDDLSGGNVHPLPEVVFSKWFPVTSWMGFHLNGRPTVSPNNAKRRLSLVPILNLEIVNGGRRINIRIKKRCRGRTLRSFEERNLKK